MKLLKILLATALIAGTVAPDLAFAKKNPSSNGAPTAEQKRKAYENGIKTCRKQWGARLHEVHVEKFYGKWSVVCYHY